MLSRRQILAGGTSGLGLLFTGCSNVLEGVGTSPSSDDEQPERNGDSSTDESDSGSTSKDDDSTAATIVTELSVDRTNEPRLGDSIAVKFAVTNDSEKAESYDYRLRLEHEDGILGGDETVSGTLSAGKRRVYDLEFLPPRAGTVSLLVEKDVVDEFVVRSRRSDDDDDSDEADEDDEIDDGTPVTTGGEATVVGDEAIPT